MHRLYVYLFNIYISKQFRTFLYLWHFFGNVTTDGILAEIYDRVLGPINFRVIASYQTPNICLSPALSRNGILFQYFTLEN